MQNASETKPAGLEFNILNRFTGAVQFTAVIDCAADALPRLKLGLAVRVAVKARADLSGADLSGAYLSGAYLSGAYLSRADLSRADLSGADLWGADLWGAKWHDGIAIDKRPIFVEGLLPYRVIILDQHMQIGCELHTLAAWDAFDERAIIAMDGRRAAQFWAAHKVGLMAIARGSGRSFEPVASDAKAEAA
jgi:hypothetical protein